MAGATKPTTVRLDADLKAQANEILDSIGLSFNSYVVMATHQLVNQRKIPFDIIPEEPVPNEETRKALLAAEAKELGMLTDDAASFDDVDSLMAYLDDE